LLAVLCFAAVLSLSLSSYLAVCYRSLVLSNRGMQSTHSIELAEVGMEEALWALNNNDWSGWTIAGTTATKTLTGFTYENETGAVNQAPAGQVQLTVTNYNKTVANFASAPTPNIGITSVGIVTLASGATFTRTLQSDARPAQLFTNAIGATGSVTFANGGTIDSYDSSLGDYTSTDPAHLTAGNSSAVVSGASANVSSAQIYGFAATIGPALLSQPSAKIIGPSTPNGVNIDPARVSLSATQPLFDVVSPSVVDSFDPVTSSAQLTNSVTLSTSGAYHYDSINLSDGVELTIQAPVVLKVSNSVQTSGSGRIYVDTGGSLQLLIDEDDGHGLTLQGAGIVNSSRQPKNVSVLVGRNYSGNSSSLIDVTSDFYGSIYLPNDSLTVANSPTIYGAMIGKNINFTGSAPAIHYDTALLRIGIAGVNTPFALVQLRELSPAEP
jgi:hypothetical protein